MSTSLCVFLHAMHVEQDFFYPLLFYYVMYRLCLMCNGITLNLHNVSLLVPHSCPTIISWLKDKSSFLKAVRRLYLLLSTSAV